jgi:hypothetical protein
MLEELKDKINFYRHHTNWHKHPVITRFLCYMGRHDYEFIEADGNHGILECFYCLQRKGSTHNGH